MRSRFVTAGRAGCCAVRRGRLCTDALRSAPCSSAGRVSPPPGRHCGCEHDPMTDGFDLTETYVHLGLGATATPLPGFTWSDEYLADYGQRFSGDGAEGRLVCVVPQDATWEDRKST